MKWADRADFYENCSISQNCQPVAAPYPVLPLTPLPTLPVTLGRTIRNGVFFDTAISTVYIETIRDNEGIPFEPKRWQIIAHELGHSTVDYNGDYASPGDQHGEGALMAEATVIQDTAAYHRFSSPTILRFRAVKKW